MRVGYSLAMNAMQRIRLAVFAILLATASALPAHSQSATGSIEGIVLDSSGAVLPGVTVTAVHRDTGASRSTVSDESGVFRLPLLPVGTYEVTAELGGFSTRKQSEVVLTIGQTATLRVEMAVAGLAETVTVSGASPVLETSRTSASSTVDETAVQNLPVNGRNFIDFALLTPGVTRDVRTGDISFAGQRGRSTAWWSMERTATTRFSDRRPDARDRGALRISSARTR